MRTNDSSSGREQKISLALCLPSNRRAWRDVSSLGTRQNTTSELIDCETLLARVAGQELNLGIRELLASQEHQHLVPEEVGGDDLTHSGRLPVAPHQLLP